jgi:ABC-type Fe2+-enterobactin transport system substrate-binding protein
MTVVNYSVQDIISPERRVFVGTEWFTAVMRDEELHGALLRQLGFSLAVIPKANAPKQPIEGMTIVAVDRLTEAIERVR